MKQLVTAAYNDPHNSVDLYDTDRLNDWNGLYCVAPGILLSQVPFFWDRYSRDRTTELKIYAEIDNKI